MNYNDEKMLSPASYQEMANQYSKTLKEKGFVFVSLDSSKEEALLHEAFELFYLLKGSLLALGGFLGTGALYSLNEKHLQKMTELYNKEFEFEAKHYSHDKTKTFLNMLSLESKLINKLLSLAEQSNFSKEIFEIIKERTHLLSSLFKINSVIS